MLCGNPRCGSGTTGRAGSGRLGCILKRMVGGCCSFQISHKKNKKTEVRRSVLCLQELTRPSDPEQLGPLTCSRCSKSGAAPCIFQRKECPWCEHSTVRQSRAHRLQSDQEDKVGWMVSLRSLTAGMLKYQLFFLNHSYVLRAKASSSTLLCLFSWVR